MNSILNSSTSNTLPGYAIGLIIAACLLVIIAVVLIIVKKLNRGKNKQLDLKDKIERLLSSKKDLSFEQFDRIKQSKVKEEGLYIIFNIDKNMFYVGYTSDILKKVDEAISSDYKYGNRFKIKLAPLDGSGYTDLKALYDDIVNTYKSFAKQY